MTLSDLWKTRSRAVAAPKDEPSDAQIRHALQELGATGEESEIADVRGMIENARPATAGPGARQGAMGYSDWVRFARAVAELRSSHEGLMDAVRQLDAKNSEGERLLATRD
jgi:hypothetical protein